MKCFHYYIGMSTLCLNTHIDLRGSRSINKYGVKIIENTNYKYLIKDNKLKTQLGEQLIPQFRSLASPFTLT